MKSLLFLLILPALSIFPQSINISGKIADSTNNAPLARANIILIHLPDSTSSGTASNNAGDFFLNDVKPGNYLLKISYIGFKTRIFPLKITKWSFNLHTISLVPGDVTMEQIEIIAQVPPVIQNADTTEFNADGFKTHKDATAEDLVGKMPGVTVTDGKVKTQGEDVKKVLVDGRNFFGDDPTAVLRNLPAEIVDKVQVFDEQSEQSRFTGFDDGNRSKTMNVVTRNRIRKGTFGRFSAGLGDDQRYSAAASLNIFNNDQRISILGQINNINEQNFSREDLLGIFQGSGRRGGFGQMLFSMQGQGPGPMMTFGRGPDMLVNTMNGLSTTKAIGINYSDKYWNKVDLSGSYFLNFTGNEASSQIKREYLLRELSGQNYYEDDNSSSSNINHRFNMRLEYQIDTLNSINFRPRFSLQQNSGSNWSKGETLSGADILNSIKDNSESDLTGVNSSAELLYRHRFETRGRTFSVSLNGNYNLNKGSSSLYSQNTYFNIPSLSDTFNQTSDPYRNGKGMSANIMYTEPIGENSMMQFSTGFSFSKEYSDQKKFNETPAGRYLDSTLSSLADKKYNTRTFGTGYRYQLENLSFNAGINYNISGLTNAQQFPYISSMEKRFTSFLPSVNLRYEVSRDRFLQFFYRASNNDPGISQLQDVLDNSNPLQLKIGNPDLKQDYRHSFSLMYSQMSMETLNSFFVMANAVFTNNYIGNRTMVAGKDTAMFRGILLNPGTQITSPSNLDGYINAILAVTYSIPLQFILSNVNLNVSGNYSRTPGIINEFKGFTNSSSYTFGLDLTSNISPELDYTLSGSTNLNFVKSSLRKSTNENYHTNNVSFRFRHQFLENIVFTNNVNYSHDKGLSDDYNRNLVLWNLSLGYKLFENNQGEIRISAYDLLNKNTSVQRTTGDIYIQDTKSNSIGRYFILSFIYLLKSFGS